MAGHGDAPRVRGATTMGTASETVQAERAAGDETVAGSEASDEPISSARLLIDEVGARRPDFVAGRRVAMADGQSWSLPCPEVSYVPKFDEARGVGLEAESSFGPDFERKVEAVRSAISTRDEAAAAFALAIDLLRRNYDLGPDQYRELLGYRLGEPGAARHLEQVYLIACGLLGPGDDA